MPSLNPEKLQVKFQEPINEEQIIPRKYTITHSDFTGELFLTIGEDFDYNQISGLYTRWMRDEVLAEWQKKDDQFELHVYVHISGGFVFGWASLRNRIIRSHLPLVLEIIRYGDRKLFDIYSHLDETIIIVHFQSKRKKFDKIENFGEIKKYSID
ncbi:MAG: hypothetical protein GF308_08310 [Candidatus Heimdallarchaeota archaeon]|nr:hypothetical protein [Candidatus Heimdallarchaeota archaeon]